MIDAVPAPPDWPALRAVVRGVAEELMPCPTVEAALAKWQKDRAPALATIWFANEFAEEDVTNAMQRAYASTLKAEPLPPLQAFATYLIELCKI